MISIWSRSAHGIYKLRERSDTRPISRVSRVRVSSLFFSILFIFRLQLLTRRLKYSVLSWVFHGDRTCMLQNDYRKDDPYRTKRHLIHTGFYNDTIAYSSVAGDSFWMISWYYLRYSRIESSRDTRSLNWMTLISPASHPMTLWTIIFESPNLNTIPFLINTLSGRSDYQTFRHHAFIYPHSKH